MKPSAHEPAADIPVLDRNTLDSIRGLGQPGAPDPVAELCALFFEDMEGRLTRIRRAMGAGDRAEVARQAHAMKGTAGNLGARRMYQAARRLEAQARGGEPAGELAAELSLELERFREVIDREILGR